MVGVTDPTTCCDVTVFVRAPSVPRMLQDREDREVAAEMGGDHWRGAVGVGLVRVGAVGEQCFDGVEVAMLYGEDESRAALRVGAIHVDVAGEIGLQFVDIADLGGSTQIVDRDGSGCGGYRR